MDFESYEKFLKKCFLIDLDLLTVTRSHKTLKRCHAH